MKWFYLLYSAAPNTLSHPYLLLLLVVHILLEIGFNCMFLLILNLLSLYPSLTNLVTSPNQNPCYKGSAVEYYIPVSCYILSFFNLSHTINKSTAKYLSICQTYVKEKWIFFLTTTVKPRFTTTPKLRPPHY